MLTQSETFLVDILMPFEATHLNNIIVTLQHRKKDMKSMKKKLGKMPANIGGNL